MTNLHHFPVDVDWNSIFHMVVDELRMLGFQDPTVRIEDSTMTVEGSPVRLMYHPNRGFTVEQSDEILCVEVALQPAVRAFVTRVAVAHTAQTLTAPFTMRR